MLMAVILKIILLLLRELIGLKRSLQLNLNISCPNVKMGGMAFGTNPNSAREVTSEVRKVYPKMLIVKLSPNVTNIVDFARIAEEEGADSVSLINTLLGMAVDIKTMKPSCLQLQEDFLDLLLNR